MSCYGIVNQKPDHVMSVKLLIDATAERWS